MEAIGADFIDESEVLTPADDKYHIDKHSFKLPFVCGAKNIGEAMYVVTFVILTMLRGFICSNLWMVGLGAEFMRVPR